MTSVRRTLLVTLLAAVAAVTLVAALLVYRVVREEIDTLLDYHLRQIALTLGGRGPGGGTVALGAGEGLDVVIQLWDLDGARLWASAPDADLPETAVLGFSRVRTASGAWRVYATELAGVVVQVAQPERVRRDLAFAAASRTLLPVVLVLPLLALLVWRSVGRALGPLDRLARTVAARTPAALDAIPEAAAPVEALPLVRSLNALLARLSTALSAQRAFVADAAHELRTPLAALRLQVDLVERAAGERERAAALADLRAGLERTTHVVQQLLTLARAEPDAVPALAGERVSLAELVGQAVADHAILAESRRVDLGAAHVSEDATVVGDPTALRTLLANLVENAIRHTPEGGRVDLSAAGVAGRPRLEVVDSGPGIPEPERARVFDRFYRRSGAGGTGAGLGLAIVKAVADRHGATVTLGDAPGGGLVVRVEFPARPAAGAADASPVAPGPKRDAAP